MMTLRSMKGLSTTEKEEQFPWLQEGLPCAVDQIPSLLTLYSQTLETLPEVLLEEHSRYEQIRYIDTFKCKIHRFDDEFFSNL